MALQQCAFPEPRHCFGFGQKTALIIEVNHRSVVGLQRQAHVDYHHAIFAVDDPIISARQHRAVQPLASKMAAGDGGNAAQAGGGLADADHPCEINGQRHGDEVVVR